MAEFVKFANKSELPAQDEAKEFACGEKTLCIANVEGVLTALDNVCLHRGGPLGQGLIDGGKIVCPWHGWQYDSKSGETTHNPAMKVAVYPIKLEGEDVLVAI